LTVDHVVQLALIQLCMVYLDHVTSTGESVGDNWLPFQLCGCSVPAVRRMGPSLFSVELHICEVGVWRRRLPWSAQLCDRVNSLWLASTARLQVV